MRYKVLIEGYPMLGLAADKMHLPAIPGTAQELILDTQEGLGKTIGEGYLRMQGIQGGTAVNDERRKFREAINAFCRFLAGEGRDNCNQVTSIDEADKDSPLLNETSTAFLLANVLSHGGDSNSPLKYKPRES